MDNSSYREFGYHRFGPFLYGFVRWLKKELVGKGYNKVFFFSRDGFMMKKAFDLINDTDIVSQYVYVSRKCLRLPLLHDCSDFEDSLKYLSWERYISIGKLLEYYGFDESEREQLAAEGTFSLDTAIPYDEVKKYPLAQRLYEDNKDEIYRRSREQDGFLLEYTGQLGMRGKYAIVDIGWHGNMQYYLEQFMRNHDLTIGFEGFYIGILPAAMLTTEVHGYMYDPENPTGYKKMLCFFGVSEKLLQGFEGSTAGYARENKKVVPKLMSYEYEGDEQVVSAIESWQAGALAYVNDAKERRDETSDKQLTKPLMKFGMKPRLKDTKLLSFFYNIDGTKVYYTAQKPLFRYKTKELKRALADSPWKTGFMKSVFKVPFPYYTVYKLLKK